jgi:small redox-active disulfide protein 2
MNIKILGPGCYKCDALEKHVKETVDELQLDATIEHVKDINKILEYPILTTPGLVINEQVVCSGRVPSKEEVSKFITNAQGQEEKS